MKVNNHVNKKRLNKMLFFKSLFFLNNGSHLIGMRNVFEKKWTVEWGHLE